MTALIVGAAVWLAIFLVIAWQLRRRNELTRDDPDDLRRISAGTLPMLLARPQPDDEEDAGKA